jgi:hypothetical protein
VPGTDLLRPLRGATPRAGARYEYRAPVFLAAAQEYVAVYVPEAVANIAYWTPFIVCTV